MIFFLQRNEKSQMLPAFPRTPKKSMDNRRGGVNNNIFKLKVSTVILNPVYNFPLILSIFDLIEIIRSTCFRFGGMKSYDIGGGGLNNNILKCESSTSIRNHVQNFTRVLQTKNLKRLCFCLGGSKKHLKGGGIGRHQHVRICYSLFNFNLCFEL